jgi:hypothetical protein
MKIPDDTYLKIWHNLYKAGQCPLKPTQEEGHIWTMDFMGSELILSSMGINSNL